MITTVSMGLKAWDQPNDVFSYVDLANNLGLIDQHDHTSGKGVQIPTGGLANLAVSTSKLADSSVTATKIANNAITDSKYLNTNNNVYRTIASATGYLPGGSAIGTYVMPASGLMVSGASATPAFKLINWDPAYYSVNGKLLGVRILVTAVQNDVSPTATFTFDVRPITGGAGSSNLSLTSGAAVSGMSVMINGAPPNNVWSTASPDADGSIMAKGTYAFFCTTSLTSMAPTASPVFTVDLQVHHI